MLQRLTPQELFHSTAILRDHSKAVYFHGYKVIGIRHFDENTLAIKFEDGIEKHSPIDNQRDCLAVVELEWSEFA